jgi:hypothetical protein
MSILRARKWDVTAIEIALDVEASPSSDPLRLVFSGPAEPRICLVVGFALTSHLRHIIAAVDRAAPPRLPSGLQAAPAKVRSSGAATGGGIALSPMPALLRLQSRFIHAIMPGMAPHPLEFSAVHGMDEVAAQFIRDFLPSNALPTLEASRVDGAFTATELRALGITLYELGNRGAPQSILRHWSYVHDSIHL